MTVVAFWGQVCKTVGLCRDLRKTQILSVIFQISVKCEFGCKYYQMPIFLILIIVIIDNTN